MFRFVNGILDRIFAALGGFLLSQAPLYMQQYIHRLAGHVEELQIQVSMMRNAASLTGKSLDQYVGKFLASLDPDFVNQGVLMHKMVLRWENLTGNLAALQEASPLTRPFVFASHLNWEIAKASLDNFQPGIAFNVETCLYMLLGIVCGFLIYNGFSWLCRKAWQTSIVLTRSEKKVAKT